MAKSWEQSLPARTPPLTYNHFKRESPKRDNATLTRNVLNNASSTPRIEVDRNNARLVPPDTRVAETSERVQQPKMLDAS